VVFGPSVVFGVCAPSMVRALQFERRPRVSWAHEKATLEKTVVSNEFLDCLEIELDAIAKNPNEPIMEP
jgi:hypothetical protein